jgi:hypothetical protein
MKLQEGVELHNYGLVYLNIDCLQKKKHKIWFRFKWLYSSDNNEFDLYSGDTHLPLPGLRFLIIFRGFLSGPLQSFQFTAHTVSSCVTLHNLAGDRALLSNPLNFQLCFSRICCFPDLNNVMSVNYIFSVGDTIFSVV